MYNECYEFLLKHLAKQLQGIIYLQTTQEICLKRTKKKRARHGEEGISIDCFNQLHTLHENCLNNEETKKEIQILRLNTDEEFEENQQNQERTMDSTKIFIDLMKTKNLNIIKMKNFP